jgi:GH43 family beta-xylosidase
MHFLRRRFASLCAVLLLLPALPSAKSPDPAADWRRSFVNPIYEGADPWVVEHEGYYYTCQSEANRGVAIHRSRRITDLGAKRVVWRAPEQGDISRQIWAPELHRIGDRWYVYVAASDGRNENHRMIVLESEGDDPQGDYAFKGVLYTGDDAAGGMNNRWAIDGTMLEHDGQLYHVWSGWEDERDEQFLYIATMSAPWTISSNRVRLAENDDYLWERVDEAETGRGLHEAPQILQRGDRVFIVYSASGSWQPSYKLGLLELAHGGDPMKPGAWVKHPEPVFAPTDVTLGTAHATFVRSPDGSQDWMLYHAKVDREPGWRRAVHAKPFTWGEDGRPIFGTPPAAGTPLPLPSGEPPIAGDAEGEWTARDDFSEPFRSRWQYFGHQQFVVQRDGRLYLGVRPREPVNVYRGGEKVLLRGKAFGDGTVAATVRVEAGEADAGILLRIQHPGIGYDAQKGYFAAIVPGTDLVIAGKSDGHRWTELARAPAPQPIEESRDYRLEVTAEGGRFRVSLDGRDVLSFEDADYAEGLVGLRVVDTLASFDDVVVEGR